MDMNIQSVSQSIAIYNPFMHISFNRDTITRTAGTEDIAVVFIIIGITANEQFLFFFFFSSFDAAMPI